MANYRDRPDFAATNDAAAERLGISAAIVEKDYWVTQALRILARDFAEDFIFKGGTSLSKGYRLVERFSEDIDVLVLPGDRSRGANDRLMKEMGEAAAACRSCTSELIRCRPGTTSAVGSRLRVSCSSEAVDRA